ncbi:MAG: RpnC/YadD family protein [Ktedonobacteraceae bacterium]
MAKRALKEPSADQQQPYDNLLKSLFEGQEKQLLPYFLPGAEYLATLNVEVIRPPLRVDRVYKVKYKGKRTIVHLEFESGSNNDMADRLLEYHAYLRRKYTLTVISIIVYPFPTKMVESPLREKLEEQDILIFHFRVFPLWELQAKQYINEHAVLLYALLPTMQGANAPLLHKAIDDMVKYYKGNEAKLAEELRWMGIALRKVKTLPRNEKREIQERLNMWDDLMERDPKMKKIRKESKAQGIAEGKAQGVAEGLAKGKTQGLAEGLQKAVITAITLRFPPLTELAQQKVSQVQKPETLNLLLDKVTTVPDEDTVRLLLDFIAA